MSASLWMSFHMNKGSDEDYRAILRVLERIGKQDLSDLPDLDVHDHSFDIYNDFPNIWGDDWLEPSATPYIFFAEAALNAEWEASSERSDESTDDSSQDKACYANGKIQYKSIEHEADKDAEWEEITIRVNKYFRESQEGIEGKTFVIDGEMRYSFSLESLTKCIEIHGGQIADSVSKNTDYLVCNDTVSSSEAKKAAELGVKVISEEEFASRFGDPYDDDVDFEHNLKDIDFDEDDEEGYDF